VASVTARRALLPLAALGCLALGGAVLWSAIPGIFSLDEANYMVTALGLRQGRLSVPGTEELPPSPELLYFDPNPRPRQVTATPVSSTAPPLYAFFAWPLLPLGWKGLVALNALSYLVSAWLVAGIVSRLTSAAWAPWLAGAIVLLGSFNVEYAQGVWPQMLSVALCTGAVAAALRGRLDGRGGWGLAGGVLSGLAAGVRYQNAAFAGLLWLGLLAARARRRVVVLFAAGFLLPVCLSSAINLQRLGSANPFSKGARYLSMPSPRADHGRLAEAFLVTWARLVDNAAWPAFRSPAERLILPKDVQTGAFIVLGGLRKALAQSAPWTLVALLPLVIAWRPVSRAPAGARDDLRMLSLPVFGMLAVFAAYGFSRHAGWAFNQRYLLELMPILTVSLVWLMAEGSLDGRRFAFGLAGGGLLAAVPLLLGLRDPIRIRLLLYLPLVLAAGALALALAVRRPGPWATDARRALAAVVGASLAWACLVHIGDDVAASRRHRAANLAWQQAYDRALPHEPAAVLAYWGGKDALAPLQLGRDLLILDTWIDDGRDAPALVDALLRAGRRRVFVATRDLPPALLARILQGRQAALAAADGRLIEVLALPAPASQGASSAGGR